MRLDSRPLFANFLAIQIREIFQVQIMGTNEPHLGSVNHDSTVRRKRTTGRDILLRMGSLFAGAFLCLVLMEIVLRILPTSDATLRSPLNAKDPLPHFFPNKDFHFSKGALFSLRSNRHSNNYGFFNMQDYEPNSTKPLLAIIGDSYVAARFVDDDKTFYGLLSDRVQEKGRVYSFGVPGAPLPTYLAYTRFAAQEFKPDGLIIPIIGNDFDQSLYKYKNFPGFYYFAENSDGELPIERVDYAPSPVKRFSRKMALIRYLFLNLNLPKKTIEFFKLNAGGAKEIDASSDNDEERIQVSRKAVDAFLDRLPMFSGLIPQKILFLINRGKRNYRIDDPIPMDFKELMFQYFMSKARALNYQVIDLAPVYKKDYKQNSQRFSSDLDPHWNQHGHRLIAQTIQSSTLFETVFSETGQPAKNK